MSDKILIICEVLGVTPYELLSGAEHIGQRSRENMTYVIDKGTELGILVESYQQLEENMQRKVLGYMEALRELQGALNSNNVRVSDRNGNTSGNRNRHSTNS